jgi:hypothetical protein
MAKKGGKQNGARSKRNGKGNGTGAKEKPKVVPKGGGGGKAKKAKVATITKNSAPKKPAPKKPAPKKPAPKKPAPTKKSPKKKARKRLEVDSAGRNIVRVSSLEAEFDGDWKAVRDLVQRSGGDDGSGVHLIVDDAADEVFMGNRRGETVSDR